MKECVSSANISILVNGSPTDEFKVGRGLRQGDPLSPFLFLIVAEGLNALFNKATGLGLFEGYKVGELPISHLQFADDTLIIGEKSSKNVWAIKVLLQLFESVSGLEVNFHKSQLLGVNVGDVWLERAAGFLNCKIGVFPFVYLGLPIGADARKKSTWVPVVEKIRRRLSSWDSSHLSLGGKVVLLKSVPYALPIFYLSFFRVPVGVTNQIEILFRRFLWWGGWRVEGKSIGLLGQGFVRINLREAWV